MLANTLGNVTGGDALVGNGLEAYSWGLPFQLQGDISALSDRQAINTRGGADSHDWGRTKAIGTSVDAQSMLVVHSIWPAREGRA